MKTFVYEKKVNNERKLYGNTTAGIPTVNDVELTYKDADGDVITLIPGDQYVDDRKGGIIRKSDDKPVNVFIGDTQIIGQPVTAKSLKAIAVKTMPTKVTYTTAESLDLTGLVIEATYSDGDKAAVTGYTTEPANGASLASATVGENTVNVSYTAGEVTKTTSFKITVSAPVVEDEEDEEPENE